MKVMILVPSFGRSSPIIGAFLFAKYLHEHDKNVSFVSLDDNYNSQEHIIDRISKAGIDFKCLNIKGWWGLLSHRTVVQDYCNEEGVDIVIAYELRPTLITATLSNVVKIVSVRGMIREAYPHTYPYGKVTSNFFASLQIKALKKMDHIFSLTKPMSDWLSSEGTSNDKVSIVNNFVDVREINSSIENNGTNKTGETINIGMFCNFTPLKRIDTALVAIKKAISVYQNHKIRLHLAGSGILFDKMKQLSHELKINDKVIFHNFLANPLQLMQQMDLVLLTSESEGVPRCLMEALSLGKTIIASDIPGVNELIKNGETGYLFPVGNADKLASLVNHVIKYEAYLPHEQLEQFMLENHDVNVTGIKMLDQIEETYKEVNSIMLSD